MSLNWGKTTAPSSFTGRVDRRWPSLFDRLKSSAAIKVDAERKVKRGASGDVMGVPDEVRVAFAGAPHLSMPQLAKAMRMDLKTLKGHREAQNLPVHIKGTGLERRRYVCTLSDVKEFYRRTTGEACQSSGSKTRPTSNSISRSKVTASTARPKAKMNVRLRKSRKRSGLKPMTVAVACDRWWDQVGKHGSDPDLERALNWLADHLGPQVALHDINDDMVSSAVEARRKCVMRAGVDDKGKQLYRPIGNRTVNKTVTSLLRRVMRKARKAWSVTILKEPDWKEHFLTERKRPVREITAEEDVALDNIESIEYAQLREFAEIMGLRRKELLLTWPQVDFNEKVIRIIGKGDVPATLPLTRRAFEILWGLRGNDKLHVFTFVAQRTDRKST